MKIPIYIISLADAVERRRAISERLNSLGLSFKFIDAIDGRNGLPSLIGYPAIKPIGFPSDTAIACTLSHHKAHRIIASGNIPHALILEDDIGISDDFPAVLSHSTTIDCDVVKFEGLRTLKYSVKRHAFGAYSFSIPHTVTSGSAGYLICKAAALKFANQQVIDMPVDDLLDDHRLALRVMEVEPRPIWQDNKIFTSQNCPTRTLARDSKLKRLVALIKKSRSTIKVHGSGVALSIARQRFASIVGIKN